MNGRLYYHYNVPTTEGVYPGFACVDLRTGEELWRKEDAFFDVGQLWDYDSVNQHGVNPYLWNFQTSVVWKAEGRVTLPTASWIMYDPFTGIELLSFENASRGTIMYGADGTMYCYNLNGFNNWMTMWNSTKAFHASGFIPRRGHMNPRPGVYDWRDGIEWNVTIPDIPGIQSMVGIASDTILAKATHTKGPMGWNEESATYVAYNLAGEQLWVKNITIPGGWVPNAMGQGIFVLQSQATRRIYAYSLQTGQFLWETEPLSYPWGCFITRSIIASDKVFVGSWDGYLYAFDIADGKLAWKYFLGDSGKETATGSWTPEYGPMIAEGVVFVGLGDFAPSEPQWRGAKLHAIDVETGDGIWNVSGWMRPSAIVDDSLLVYNDYDCRVYCFGKGNSATTIESPMTAAELGDKIVLRGTVTDQSPGKTCRGVPAAGTPAISDEDMSEWMEYLYMQKPRPEDVEGVEVTLQIQDPHGDWYQATVTADENGVFSHVWTPGIVGEYHVTALFEGSNSYYPSQTTTTFTIDQTQAAEDVPSAEEIADTTVNRMPAYPTIPEIPAYLTIDLAILIVAALSVIIGLIAYMALRKQQ
jgi:outer membrane protein assembly factor BamB